MDQLAETFAKYHRRLNEIVNVLARYGFAAWAASSEEAIPGVKIAQRLADPDVAALSLGERLRGAATDLGTTYVKFGQMLSLRPDLVGPDVAAELEKLQTSVAPDPPDVVRDIVGTELGAPISELFATFDANAMGSGSVAQVHRATTHDGGDIVVKVLHAGVDKKVAADLELMRALATFLEEQDPEIAQYRPTTMVAEFDKMMRGAIDMGQELANLERFTANFAAEPDVVIPTPYREFSSTRVVTMSRLVGQGFSDRATLEAAGWDVEPAGAPSRADLPGDDLSRRRVPRGSASRQLPAASAGAGLASSTSVMSGTSPRRVARSSRASSLRSAPATWMISPTRSWR